jgi:alkaline phosphatase
MTFLLFLFASAFASNNIILFIGDGMGPSVVTASRIHYKELAWDKFPHSAFVTTKSNDNHVTDSAAAATAMASGVKTDNEVLGYGPQKNGKREKLVTLADMAKAKKYSVGLVTTTTVTHATPAAFYAHNENRNDGVNIVNDLFNSNLDLVYGGSIMPLEEAIKKNPDRFVVINHKKDLPSKSDKPILGLFEIGETPYTDTDKFDKKVHPTLVEMTHSAVEILSKNKNGFFLVVEGGRIDHALHKNNIPQALIETNEFSKAVAEAMYLLKKANLLKNTLVVVTADHDTAGLSVNGYLDINKPILSGRKIATSDADLVAVLTSVSPKIKTSAAHTAVDVPLYASGICSETFAGLIDNTDIFKRIKSCLQK